jgi:FkbM family methyltransferase
MLPSLFVTVQLRAMRSCKIQIAEEELTFFGHEDSYLDHLVQGNESNLAEYSRDLIPPNATILDIGANIGFVSALFSVYNPKSIIYALEPGNENFNFLTKNIETNHLNNIHPLKIAASFENSEIGFNEHSAWGYLESKENQLVGSQTVEVMTIDSLVLKLNLQKVDLIKIDVEGFEGQVFEGMRETLKKFNPKVIFEFNTFCMLAYGRRNPLDFLEYIDKSFTNVFRFAHGSTEGGLTLQMEKNFGISALHENIVSHGSVDDFLVWN